MPLVKTTLANGLRKFIDETYSSFDKFPQDEDEAIAALADAVDGYASAVIPASTTASTAKEAMKKALSGMSDADQAISKIKSGFSKYADELAKGMAGAGFNGMAPVAEIPIDAVENIGLNGGTSEDVASAIADIADLWFKTGTTTSVSNGAPGPTWT